MKLSHHPWGKGAVIKTASKEATTKASWSDRN